MHQRIDMLLVNYFQQCSDLLDMAQCISISLDFKKLIRLKSTFTFLKTDTEKYIVQPTSKQHLH